VLFPEFEGRTGIVMGPTQVMRMEHAPQARELIERYGKGIGGKERKEIFCYRRHLYDPYPITQSERRVDPLSNVRPTFRPF
jgi:hypothetical protein